MHTLNIFEYYINLFEEVKQIVDVAFYKPEEEVDKLEGEFDKLEMAADKLIEMETDGQLEMMNLVLVMKIA